MTLRLRLVLALAALLTMGLLLFGVTTYGLYARAERNRLDTQLAAAIPLVTSELKEAAGVPTTGPGGAPPRGRPEGRGGRPGPPVVVAPGTYAELRAADGSLVADGTIQASDQTSQPSLPAVLKAEGRSRRFFDADSASGSGSWRVVVSPDESGDRTIVVATPLTEVRESLDRLVAIEATAAVVLLSVLAAGSWLILRRGLRPLESMAATAATITAGDLSQRVEPADGTTEVGQLGLALNTMLGQLEGAFQERADTERRLRQFLADASHELRTPLTSIQGFAELFRMGASSEHVDRDVIMRRIEQESARMKTLVEDLLLLARLDQIRPADRVAVDLAVLAADACSDAVAAAPERPITLHAPAPVDVLGVPDHLRQAIANLVTNALKHTPDGTPIEVTTRVEAGRAVVEVRDHGGGLDAEALQHAFDRFWQADAARVGRGAGLGLSIVAGIAAEHGGEATAANAEGGGARFTLRLPLDEAIGGPRADPQAALRNA